MESDLQKYFAEMAYQGIFAIDKFDYRHCDDLTSIFKIFDKIKVLPEFVPGMFQETTFGRLMFRLYAYRKNNPIEFVPSYEKKEMITRHKILGVIHFKKKHEATVLTPSCYEFGMHITGIQQEEIEKIVPSIYSFLHVDFNIKGIWQLFLVQMMEPFMNDWWQGPYHGRYYVLVQRNYELINEMYPLSSLPDEIILPQVSIVDENTARVICCYLGPDHQLYRETVIFKKEEGFVRLFSKMSVLIKGQKDLEEGQS